MGWPGGARPEWIADDADAVLDPIRTEFGRAIRQLRHERGWTQVRLALACGVDQSTISRLERGVEIHVRFSTVIAVLTALRAHHIVLDSDDEAGIGGFMRRSDRERWRRSPAIKHLYDEGD
jgi:transcriptional regulator with XRE-family HTH domain